MSDDQDRNNLVAAGALLSILQQSRPLGPLAALNVVPDADGNATNQIEVEIDFLKSAYRLTVEQVTP